QLLQRGYPTTSVLVRRNRNLEASGARAKIHRLERFDDRCSNFLHARVARQGERGPELGGARRVLWLVAPERTADARYGVGGRDHEAARAGVRHHQRGVWKNERVRDIGM